MTKQIIGRFNIVKRFENNLAFIFLSFAAVRA